MGIFTWLLVGAIAGWLSGKFVKGKGFGLFGNIIIGIVGALVGGWVAGELFGVQNAVSGFNLGTIFVAFLGAVLVLQIAKLVRK
ncbi:GlsB/YeaQ/YmgE family stress response membrane protein [Anaerotalea alkaliphila]|uniref:GlsB/YeaQ/YmgE family stress response membrane protein n=1 Tax=Anaerotalea alkaliphila TaxID=2662126 RepID=A0A7X5KPA5_9FIRM|nr:GlsB/YeaQ/YmgE family stress response membrane protein [Anaerotalea alkaliphila]NDL68823.1 GlsB/YeaQ/YmgE family stress response membrane protein [Anaerotalea alkaliphila]